MYKRQADYYVEFRPGKEPEISWKDKISDFLAQPEIKVMKKTKRSEKEIPEAKNYYEKVVSIHRQIKELNEKLESLRASYIKGNKAKREQLKPTICLLYPS